MSSFASFSSENRQEFESRYTTDTKKRRYNVFLSFCARDAGTFPSRLDMALSSEAGIVVFGDVERVQHGEWEKLALDVIEDCKIAIVIFSTNYVNSSLYLKELEKITECCRTSDLTVLPVFYHSVHSSYGCSEGGMLEGGAFHYFLDRMMVEGISEEEDKFITWVTGITKATKYLGPSYLVHKPIFKYEGEYIKDIVQHVMRVLNKRDLFAASYTPSVKSVAQDMIQLLKQSKSPFLLGIWGMTGIGKSTIATAIYNQIGLFFEHKCFLENVGGVWETNSGQLSLQEELLFYIDGPTEIKIPTVESGTVMIKERLQHKRVLLVLDNVDKVEQLDALCRSRDWFGAGSKIIIMTKNRRLLREHGVDHIHKVKELNESEFLDVLKWSAFSRATSPQANFGELSRQLVAYSGGWPLALKELGKFLHGKDVPEWKGVLRSLQRFSIPAPRLLEALEKSFSDLSDEEKHIFLDIACFIK